MEGFWANIGFFAFLCVIVWVYKKIVESRENNPPYHHTDESIYEAAELFSQGADLKNVISVLMRCPDFDEAEADLIVKSAVPRRPSQGARYRAFIRSVNREIGESIYSTHHHA